MHLPPVWGEGVKNFRKVCARFFSNFKHDRGHKLDKNHWSKIFKKNPYMCRMDNFGLLAAQNYASLHLRIQFKDFLKFCNMTWTKVKRNH